MVGKQKIEGRIENDKERYWEGRQLEKRESKVNNEKAEWKILLMERRLERKHD